MPDQNTASPPPPQATSQTATPPTQKGPTIHIAEEFGTAKRNLPPVGIVLLALGGVLIIAGTFAFFQRAKPQATGTLVNVSAVQIPGQPSVLVALTFTLRNPGEKSLWVHNIAGKMNGAGGEFTSDAVSAIDFDRYFQAFPALKGGSQPALSPEDKLQPGQEVNRTVIVSFPVAIDAFKARRSLSLIVQPYDQPLPVILNE
jgi:hypothetical protein